MMAAAIFAGSPGDSTRPLAKYAGWRFEVDLRAGREPLARYRSGDVLVS